MEMLSPWVTGCILLIFASHIEKVNRELFSLQFLSSHVGDSQVLSLSSCLSVIYGEDPIAYNKIRCKPTWTISWPSYLHSHTSYSLLFYKKQDLIKEQELGPTLLTVIIRNMIHIFQKYFPYALFLHISRRWLSIIKCNSVCIKSLSRMAIWIPEWTKWE